jgi:UDP-N-acetylglucosamine acyltransferase
VIHPSAQIHPSARLGNAVIVGPFAVIEANVSIGNECEINAQAIIKKSSVLGEKVKVDHFAVVGGDPQDIHFNASISSNVSIGDSTVIREHVTIHRATSEGGTTHIGINNFIMAGAHIAHDCTTGNYVILANGCMLGGHVSVGDHAFVSGGVAVHQFCRIGCGSMTSGNAVITEDVPPHGLAHSRNQISGLNLVGMRRRGLSSEVIAEIKKAYHCVYAASGNCTSLAKSALKSGEFTTPEALEFLGFFLGGKRGRFVQPE